MSNLGGSDALATSSQLVMRHKAHRLSPRAADYRQLEGPATEIQEGHASPGYRQSRAVSKGTKPATKWQRN
jgi:hypothetical protein